MQVKTRPEFKVNEAASDNAQKAVLFADVSGSTRLYEVLGDERAFAAIDDRLEILRQLVAVHRGRVVKTIGDEIMCLFPDAMTATQAACAMLTSIAACPPVAEMRIGIRLGFHCGPLLQNDGDLFGDTVNMAARMAGIAHAGQIITTAVTVSMLPSILRTSTRRLSSLPVKGKNDGVEICEVLWQEGDEMTLMAGSTHSQDGAEFILSLMHGGVRFVVSSSNPVITMGRDEEADIVIGNRHASRMHARIERRRDKYMLVDLSSNGSYVAIKDEAEIRLRREEVLLRERGTISMGHPYEKYPADSIEFIIAKK